MFISELHYDNEGADSGEFIEVTGSAGTDLTGWRLALYNGRDGAVYDTLFLSGVIPLQENGLGTVVVDAPTNGIQNGTPDGIALVSPNGTVTEFLSYEGTLTATDGPALGQTSIDINVEESGVTPIGFSLQRINDRWIGPRPNTKGQVNSGSSNSGPIIAAIYDIQGAAHRSPLEGQTVQTSGIVTAVDTAGFYLQDAAGDNNPATADALFVYTQTSPTVAVGDAVQVEGTVIEFVSGGEATGNLSVTQLSNSPNVTLLSSSNPLPAAVVLGTAAGQRTPPNQTIDDDAFAVFDPATDGLDFWESLEGMRVTAKDLLAVSPTSNGEIYAVVDQGNGATGLSQRNTLNLSPGDFNPERVQIDEDAGLFNFDFPQVSAGALLGDVTGVVGYSFGNYEIYPTVDFTANLQTSNLQPETTALFPSSNQLLLGSYNLLNLDPNDNDGDQDIANGRFNQIAQQIAVNLNAPDIIALQEVQDNSGAEDDGALAADQTLQTLTNAIQAAGGPAYAFIDNPFITNNASGGQPGGNIRTAFLYNPSRVNFVPGSTATISSQTNGGAFAGSRLPLVASFRFNGETLTLVNNHFSSKGSSAPLLGIKQPVESRQDDPSVNGGLNSRNRQSAAVQSYVADLTAADPNAHVVVLGDLNEFEFVAPVANLTTNSGLVNLTNTLDENERYSYIFQGNSQSLDHILTSPRLAQGAEFDAVHINSEFPASSNKASDHDPILALLSLGSDVTPSILQPDFNGDGASDILSRRGAAVTVQFFERTTPAGSQVLLPTIQSPDWQIQSVGDFNGDSAFDAVWRNVKTGQNVLWHMNRSTQVTAALPLAAVTDLSWELRQSGDMDGDGDSDLLWFNPTSKAVAVWYMENNQEVARTSLSAGLTDIFVGENWQLEGSGDFDGNATFDLVWHNRETGEVRLWFMDGALNRTSESTVNSSVDTTAADLAWRIQGQGDYDGDGRSDLVWVNGTTGDTKLWLMNGAMVTEALSVR